MRLPMLTRLMPRRRLRLHSARTQRRLIFLLGGVVVGGAAVLLALLADQAQDLFLRLIARWPYAPLVLTPLGLGLSAWMTRRFFPNAQGSGIPQAIAARHLQDQAARGRLVSLRIAGGKILLTLFGLLCGAAVLYAVASVLHAQHPAWGYVAAFAEAANKEREDWQNTTKSLVDSLKGKGLIFNQPDTAPFRAELSKTGFYPEVKAKVGDEAWALLEKYVGPLS